MNGKQGQALRVDRSSIEKPAVVPVVRKIKPECDLAEKEGGERWG